MSPMVGQVAWAERIVVVTTVRERYPDGVDALLDLVSQSPDQLNAYAAVVHDGGRIASSVGAAGDGPGRTNVSGLPCRENLERLAGLLEDGTLTVPIQAGDPWPRPIRS
jgi:NADPH2:quinone reductase